MPAYSRVVLAGDFLAPLDEIRACLAQFASVPVRLHLVQVLDPAEFSLPYEDGCDLSALSATARP